MFFTMGKYTLSNLFKKPATLMYPFKPQKFFANTRGKITIDIDTCIFCGICAKKCPSDAITVDKAGRTWEIDNLKCIYCISCVEACPKKSLSSENKYFNSLGVGEKASSKESFKGKPVEPKVEVK